MALSHAQLLERARRIRLAIFDVDGVLTDGRLYFMPDGTEFKSFNTLDGHGIKLLIASGVEVAIISGRQSPLVERRAANLGIRHLIQGREDKLNALAELRQRYPRWLPFVDARWGSGAYLPMIDGARYEVVFNPRGGLVARPADAASERLLREAGW